MADTFFTAAAVASILSSGIFSGAIAGPGATGDSPEGDRSCAREADVNRRPAAAKVIAQSRVVRICMSNLLCRKFFLLALRWRQRYPLTDRRRQAIGPGMERHSLEAGRPPHRGVRGRQ